MTNIHFKRANAHIERSRHHMQRHAERRYLAENYPFMNFFNKALANLHKERTMRHRQIAARNALAHAEHLQKKYETILKKFELLEMRRNELRNIIDGKLAIAKKKGKRKNNKNLKNGAKKKRAKNKVKGKKTNRKRR